MFGCVWVQIEALPQVFDRAEQPLWLPLLSTLHFPLGGDGIVIQRTQWGVIIPTSYVKFVCIFRKNSVWISELPFFGSHLYITLRAGFSLFFLFSQASLSFITVLGVYILIKLATSPFYHVWIPCVYPSKGPRLFKVITYFSEKEWMPTITIVDELNSGCSQTQVSNLRNSRFTKKTLTILGRSHRLPHVCTTMMYGEFGSISIA